jgi:hypothetical protein
MKSFNPINRLHLFHCGLFFALLFSVCLAFYMQFKYDNLQEQVAFGKNEIAEYQDQLRLLEIEWVYLTRPERLRQLTEKFLQDNQYMLASQVQEDLQTQSATSTQLIEEQKITTPQSL